jgi:hypothetical protein
VPGDAAKSVDISGIWSVIAKSRVLKSPPRAELAFRVGVVGHRPNRLPHEKEKLDALRLALRTVLAEAKAALSRYAAGNEAKTHYAPTPFILRAVSPLAEGTDRMFAEEALDLGYSLCCPMPFAQEEFEKDFVPPDGLEQHSIERFRGILKRAQAGAGLTTFELDGERSVLGEAYGMAGRVVLNQSDLLVAVWDGGAPAGGGGTVETLREAIRFHVPVLWIEASEPDRWQLLRQEDDLKFDVTVKRYTPQVSGGEPTPQPYAGLTAILDKIVQDEIAPPKQKPAGEYKPDKPDREPVTQTNAPRYFREHKPWLNLAFVWKMFRDGVGSRKFSRPKLRVDDFVSQIRGEWPTSDDPKKAGLTSPSEVEDWVNRHLRLHYAWSDKRSDLYADAYRSAYVTTYLLSALAVAVALLPMAANWTSGAPLLTCVEIELAMLVIILALLGFGRWRQWHARWMEYRLLAELIRQLRVLVPLGGGRPFAHVPAYLGAYGNLTQTWMHWHMRAIARATGLPSAKVTPTYVVDCLNYLAKVVGVPEGGQLEFHRNTVTRSDNIAHRLHLASIVLFVLTVVGIVIHLTLDVAEPKGAVEGVPDRMHVARAVAQRWLVFCSATLPALGAALAGISTQGEFARLARRSTAMEEGFEGFAQEIASLRADGGAPKLSKVVELAGKIAAAMVEENADWRVVFIDRPHRAT